MEQMFPFQPSIIPLKAFITHREKIYDFLPLDDKDKKYVCFEILLNFLQILWDWRNSHWRAVRDKISVSLLKELNGYGNTSLSMGVCTDKIERSPSQEMSNIAVLYCDTSGIRYQHYQYVRESNLLFLKGEFKPLNGANPSHIEVAGYNPDSNLFRVVHSYERNCELLKEGIEHFLQSEDFGPETCFVSFITGILAEY